MRFSSWRQAKKCSRPGKSKITKPAVRHMPDEAWDDCDRFEINQDIKQHSFAQLFLIRKDPEVAALNRHRMLVFEDEIMKRRDSVHEVGVSRVLTKLGLMAESMRFGGITKNVDMGTAICTVASAIEDVRIRDKEFLIEFKDQEKTV